MFQDMCGAIAHEWPAYTPAQVARLPHTYFRALRALLLRAHYTPPRHGGVDDDRDLKSVDVDALLGIKEKGDAR